MIVMVLSVYSYGQRLVGGSVVGRMGLSSIINMFLNNRFMVLLVMVESVSIINY